MNSYTFGNSQAAKTLASILEKHPKFCTRKAAKLACRCNHGLKQIETVADRSVRTILFSMWKDWHVASIKDSGLPTEVKTYLTNVVTKNYRNIYNQNRQAALEQYAAEQSSRDKSKNLKRA
jgi:hypothetical protein